ncbi:ORF368 [White spot syndrome virus]|uniref:ORF368 n=1 Tax=White spot syndrome virus TaxID=342409 RepID=A0A2D3I6W9_9VIRU|nr:ORF368 [White spot syndrome virus]
MTTSRGWRTTSLKSSIILHHLLEWLKVTTRLATLHLAWIVSGLFVKQKNISRLEYLKIKQGMV